MDGGGGGRAPRAPGRDFRSHPYRRDSSRQGPPPDEKIENKLYVGNLDHRVTEYHVLKMFTPFGKIKREEYLWHTHGPRRGEPRGYAFVEYATREDAEKARAAMNGRPAFGRPLVVRFVDEKVVTYNQDAPVWTRDAGSSAVKPESQASVQSNISKSAKIAAIQNKLRTMEQEDKMRDTVKKPPTSVLPSSVASDGIAGTGQGWGPGASGPADPRAGPRSGDQQRGPHSRTLLTSGHRWSGAYG